MDSEWYMSFIVEIYISVHLFSKYFITFRLIEYYFHSDTRINFYLTLQRCEIVCLVQFANRNIKVGMVLWGVYTRVAKRRTLESYELIKSEPKRVISRTALVPMVHSTRTLETKTAWLICTFWVNCIHNNLSEFCFPTNLRLAHYTCIGRLDNFNTQYRYQYHHDPNDLLKALYLINYSSTIIFR